MSTNDFSITSLKNVYFVGIGGIGMSALARYFKAKGWNVGGYDKTPSSITDELSKENIKVHFEDRGTEIAPPFNNLDETLVVYTPAIPKDHKELVFLKENAPHLFKRAEVLGLLTKNTKGIGVAGTHGKTTTSSMLAHMLDNSIGCNAFLGGIATNFESNLVLHDESEFTVIEADEFDRSFLHLHPFASIVTSCDPDHLDIYGNEEYFREGFQKYVEQIAEDGCLVIKYGLPLQSKAKTITYAVGNNESDYTANNLRFENGKFLFDAKTPVENWNSIELGIPGIHNAENALACIALCQFLGLNEAQIRSGLSSFKGVKRRFEFIIRKDGFTYIDDYAHHPTEIHALVSSVRLLFPEQKITGVFQPHLFTRTRDFFTAFAKELSELDELILLPIYPARELPIEGVSSEALLGAVTLIDKKILSPTEVIDVLKNRTSGVLLTIGAGDIDRIVEPLKRALL
ncbi:MAG: UDP-N-acetylmuramate--L-alanine ligase [Bacteroidota bacterium]